MSFHNHTVAVTGATGALGRAVCRAFLEAGAAVRGSYILDQELAAFPPELAREKRLQLTKVDLLDETAVQAWFDGVGELDVLVNVAGGFAMAPFRDTSTRDWRSMFDINVNTAFTASREALRRFDPERGGRIVNVTAYAVSQAVGGMVAYTASKAALVQMTEALAAETLSAKITVNAVAPTIMDTPVNREAMPDADFSTWVPTEDAARTILFLADPRSWHITGAVIPMRGKL